MNKEKLIFWFYTERDLVSIGEELVKINIIESFEFDYENVYEWLQCCYENNEYELNISREHSTCVNQRKMNELIFMVLLNDTDDVKNLARKGANRLKVETLARQVANIFQVDMILGYGFYNSKDKFEYLIKNKISPNKV